MNDLFALFDAQERVRRWNAEGENAEARLTLARTDVARAYLLSQREPAASLGIDRDVLRALLAFTAHHDESRLTREIEQVNNHD